MKKTKRNGSANTHKKNLGKAEGDAKAVELISVDLTPGTCSELGNMVGHRNSEALQRAGHTAGVAHLLGSDLLRGITSDSVSARVARHGRNELPPVAQMTYMDHVKEAAGDKTILILMGAAVISLVLGMTTPDPRTGEVDRATGWIEGAAILLSVAIVVLVSSINNYQKQKQFEALKSAETPPVVYVVRDGQANEILCSDVVVGDVVAVFSGMALNFDALLIEGNGFSCDESSVTGEPDEVSKSPEHDPFLISGTNIVDGCDGLALAVAVGAHSFAGSIEMAVREQKDDTPLQVQLGEMADVIGKYGLYAAIITFVVLLLKELFVVIFHGEKFFAMKFFENLTTAVAIVVVAVPEGLPLSVTLTLAYSMKQMLRDNNLVRHLSACETMGGASIILSDKTGTLTRSDIRAKYLYIDGEKSDVTALDWGTNVRCSHSSLRHLADCVAMNFGVSFGNNKMAEALLKLCPLACNVTKYDAIAAARQLDKTLVRRFAFSSIKKQGSVVMRDAKTGTLTHYVVGAAEMILQRCNSACMGDKKASLTIDSRKVIENAIQESATSGFRTLCLAYSERSTNWSELPPVPPDDALTLIAVVGVEEPLREEVPRAISVSQNAGIRVIMVTGDMLSTAVHIARQCGIVSKETDVAMEGGVFRSKSDDELLRDIVPNLAVLGRATPLDKKRLVTLLRQDTQQTVAVTGDGTNDAPALKAAHIGFAMNSGRDLLPKCTL